MAPSPAIQVLFYRLFVSLRTLYSDPRYTQRHSWGSMLSQAIEALSAIAAAVQPSFSLPVAEDVKWLEQHGEGQYEPKPVDTSEQVCGATACCRLLFAV